MLINSTNVEAQSKKKFCDVIKKVWVCGKKRINGRAKGSGRPRMPHMIKVDCNQCFGSGNVEVTVPVTIWNPYYQCYQTQNQLQIQECAICYGSGKIQKRVVY